MSTATNVDPVARGLEQIRLAEAAIAKAEDAKIEAAEFQAAGGDAKEAQRRFEAAQGTIQRQRGAIEHTERVIARCQAEREEFERRRERAAFEAACAELERACAERQAASKHFTASVVRCRTSAATLRAKRKAVDEAVARVKELAPAGVAVELPANADEPDWPESLSEIAKTIKGGPLQPNAEAERRTAKAAEERQRSDHAQVVDAVRRGANGSAFTAAATLPQRLWPAYFEQLKEELQKAVDKRRRAVGQVPSGGPEAIRRMEELLARPVADLIAEMHERKAAGSRVEVLA